MRLDARCGDYGWTVYHAPSCKVLQGVVWVDDCLMQWFQHEIPLRIVEGEACGQVHGADRIVIDSPRRLVLIDPVADEHEGELDVLVEVPAPAVVSA